MSKQEMAEREQAAALWFAKCRRGVMAVEDRFALDAWRADAANGAALAEIERTWTLLNSAQGQLIPAPVIAVRQRVARSALLAMMCAVFIGIGMISYSGNHEFWTTLDWVER